MQGDARDAAVEAGDQVEDQGVLGHLDLGRRMHRRDERALDLGTRRVAAGVGDPVAVVAALAGQRQLAGIGVVEDGAEGDQLVDGRGAFGDQGAHGVLVAEPCPGDEGVVEVLLGGVPWAQSGRDAALRPLRRSGAEEVLGHHHH